MTILQTSSSRLATQSDRDTVQERVLTHVSVTLLVVSGVGWWSNLPGLDFRWRSFSVFMVVFLGSLAAYLLRSARPRVARAALAIALIAGHSLALTVWPDNSIPYAATVIVVALATLAPGMGLLAAALCSVATLIFRSWEQAWAPNTMTWLAAVFSWVSSQALHTTLEWSWNSQRRANELLKQLRDHQGELNRTLGALKEASYRLERTGQELANARIEAERARDSKEQMAASLSHELRTPLNLVLGFAETMYKTPEVYGTVNWTAPLRQDVVQIYESSRTLRGLLDDVLDLSRIDAAGLPVQTERASLPEIIHEACAGFDALLARKGVSLKVELQADQCEVRADPTRIRQVLANLLNNAVRYTEQGSVTVRAVSDGSRAYVSVSDTGRGIPIDEQSRIFDAFHQVTSALMDQRQGYGLGLSIARRFVELHGGRIRVESREGVGTTFSFDLPLADAMATEEATLHSHRGLDPISWTPLSPTVLALGASRESLAVLRRYLSGYEVLEVSSLDEVAGIAKRDYPRALLAMGESASNPERLGSLLPPELPVVTLSLPDSTSVALEYGAAMALPKPVSQDQLVRAVQMIEGVRDILVVDDDRGFIQLVTRYLDSTSRAYQLRRAYNGSEALAQIKRRRPDLVLLDLAMPEIDGWQVLDWLHEHERDLPVIIVAGVDLSERNIRQQRQTVVTLMPQPTSVGRVVAHLKATLGAISPTYTRDTALTPQ